MTTQITPQKVDYTAIADRLMTVSWSNQRHPTGVIYRFYRTHLFEQDLLWAMHNWYPWESQLFDDSPCLQKFT